MPIYWVPIPSGYRFSSPKALNCVSLEPSWSLHVQKAFDEVLVEAIFHGATWFDGWFICLSQWTQAWARRTRWMSAAATVTSPWRTFQLHSRPSSELSGEIQIITCDGLQTLAVSGSSGSVFLFGQKGCHAQIFIINNVTPNQLLHSNHTDVFRVKELAGR